MNYIDTSAFVKYYSEEGSEKGSARVQKLIDDAKEGREHLICVIVIGNNRSLSVPYLVD